MTEDSEATLFLRLTPKLKEEVTKQANKVGKEKGAAWKVALKERDDCIPLHVVHDICSTVYGKDHLQEGTEWMKYVFSISSVITPTTSREPLSDFEQSRMDGEIAQYNRMIGSAGVPPLRRETPQKKFKSEFRGLIHDISPVIGSVLSCIAAFVAVYFVLDSHKSFPTPMIVGYSLIAAAIVAVAEIGLYLIARRRKRMDERKKHSHTRTQPKITPSQSTKKAKND
ncbi:hypothetical protein BLNAU_16030 [Blattamonas nauphoetae]|uniref:Transmembrane protein n=1 Tax=Blattamonas nauphoetae TaxID=2049346 RepID=A0ABQ9XFR6_9EUKA|nr:hypothetical protein BLNAU_16030 [Blattamonas nauphoetae]